MSGKSRRAMSEQEQMRRKFAAFANAPIEPILLTTNESAEEAPPIHLFSIDDTPYYIPGEVSPSFALRVLEVIERDGEAAATGFAIRTMLGDEGYDALKNHKSLTKRDLATIMNVVMSRVFGVLGSGN